MPHRKHLFPKNILQEYSGLLNKFQKRPSTEKIKYDTVDWWKLRKRLSWFVHREYHCSVRNRSDH